MNKAYKKVQEENGVLGYFLSIGILISVIFSLAAIAITLQPEAEAKEYSPFLVVEDVYFVMSSTSDSRDSEDKEITMTAYITNKGQKDASNVEVKMFAVETDSNLGVDYNYATLGLIPKDTTGEATMMVNVPQGKTYRIELIVFESGRIVVRGSGSVKLIGSSSVAGEDFTVDDDNISGPSSKRGEEEKDSGLAAMVTKDEASSISAGLALGILTVVVVVIAIIALKSSKEPAPLPKPVPVNNVQRINNRTENNLQAPEGTYTPPGQNEEKIVYKQEV